MAMPWGTWESGRKAKAAGRVVVVHALHEVAA